MKRTILVIGMMLVMVTMLAQDKLSPSTHLFLMERDGVVNFDAVADSANMRLNAPATRSLTPTRPVARAQQVNGVKMVAAFVRLTNDNTAPLERLGVIIQARFKDGIVSAMLPVDKIEAIAALDCVKCVEVAVMATFDTDQSRALTNVDDILQSTENAHLADVLKRYDGTGIIVGVIDGGIQFTHKAFKDANGNTRIKRAWVLEGTSINEYQEIDALDYDYSFTAHGTHTSSTAAGSPTTIKRITYSGMAPNADIVLCGLGESLTETNIATCIQKICDYADAEGKPCVINISLGSQYGAHDGSGTLNELISQFSAPNHIIIMASANDANRKIYVHGSSSQSAPLQTALMSVYGDSRWEANAYYYSFQSIAYSRERNHKIAARLMVVDTTVNQIVWTSKEITPNSTRVINGSTKGTNGERLDKYYTVGGSIIFINTTDAANEKGCIVTNISQVHTTTPPIPTGWVYHYYSDYSLALSIYPADSTQTFEIDSWITDNRSYFTKHDDIDGCNLRDGSDSCSIQIYACGNDVISVGAYISKSKVIDYQNREWRSAYNDINNILGYSSYNALGCGPLGKAAPDITAPGAMIVSAMNSSYYNFMADYLITSGQIRVNDDKRNPYGSNSGTSMAAPCVTGIIALWQQAAIESGREPLSVDEIREVFRQTAIHDQWTDGEHGVQFGATGKIDALAGLSYILKDVPGIRYSADSLAFHTPYASSDTLTLLVKGNLLTRPVTITQGESDVFTVLTSEINVDGLDTITTVKVVYRPVAIGKDNATLTLSNGGETADVTVLLRGHCLPVAPVMLTPSDLQPTSMITHWQDITPHENVESYTLEVSSAAFNELRLSEPFDGGADISSTTDCSSRLDEITATPGWTGSKVYHGEGMVTLGSTSTKGWIMTPRLDMRGNDGLITFKVKASAVGSGILSGPLSITVGERDTVITVATDESEHIVLLPCPSSDTVRVRLSNGVKAARIKLHDLAIYAGDAYSPIDPSQISYHGGITDTTYTITGIMPGDYLLRVQATYTDGTASAWSNQVRAHLDWATGDVNRDGEVNIADVGSVIDGLLDGNPLPGSDVNGDGEVNIADVNALISIILSH